MQQRALPIKATLIPVTPRNTWASSVSHPTSGQKTLDERSRTGQLLPQADIERQGGQENAQQQDHHENGRQQQSKHHAGTGRRLLTSADIVVKRSMETIQATNNTGSKTMSCTISGHNPRSK